tara:strand:- start:221 stop:1117 length:897 start_codon:yes stop_codon:yes gene_type:complete
MRNDIPFFLSKLTVLALVAVLAGCGGGEGGGSDQNQSSTQKPDNSEGGQAAKRMDKPAEKFTPEMVKAAMEAALKQLPDSFTKEELAELRTKMMEPVELQELADELNENIVDGKIDDRGMKVDAITVEALTKAIVVLLPKAKREGDKKRNEVISGYRVGKLAKGLIGYSSDNEFRFPDSNKWCDAIADYRNPRGEGDVDELYSPQHPDTAKLKNGAPKDKRVIHYAMNKAMSGKFDTDSEVVLVFECDLGWNGAGGLEDALKYMDKFKLEKIAVSTADTSAQSATKEDLKKLKWVPEE